MIRLLIVDDIRDVRLILTAHVSAEQDIEVVGFASTGAEAIDEYERLRPDVVSMNLHMPDLDGISATEVICRAHPEARVFMVSVDNEPEMIRRAGCAGALDYLAKPVASSDYVETIRALASRTIRAGSTPRQKRTPPRFPATSPPVRLLAVGPRLLGGTLPDRLARADRGIRTVARIGYLEHALEAVVRHRPEVVLLFGASATTHDNARIVTAEEMVSPDPNREAWLATIGALRRADKQQRIIALIGRCPSAICDRAAISAGSLAAFELPAPLADVRNAIRVLAGREAGLRVMRFPPDRSLGRLYSTPIYEETGVVFCSPATLGQAQGDVPIPWKEGACLSMSEEASSDPNALDSLGPDDLYELTLEGSHITDEHLRHVARLTGLQHLTLSRTSVTDNGLRQLGNLLKLGLTVSRGSVSRATLEGLMHGKPGDWFISERNDEYSLYEDKHW